MLRIKMILLIWISCIVSFTTINSVAFTQVEQAGHQKSWRYSKHSYKNDVAEATLDFVSWCLMGTPAQIEVRNQYLYVWTNKGDVFGIFDISNLQNPVELGRLLYHEQPGASCFALWGDSVVYGINDFGAVLSAIDVSDKSNHHLMFAQHLGTIYGNYIEAILIYPYFYVTAQSKEDSVQYLYVIDVSDSLNITVVDSLNLITEFGLDSQVIKSFIVEGNYIYLTTGHWAVGGGKGKFLVIDNSLPDSLSPICSIELLDTVANHGNIWGSSHLALEKSGSYIYITGHFYVTAPHVDHYTLQIVNVSVPDSPFVDTTWDGGFKSVDIEISDDYAYISNCPGDSLFIVNISDSLNPYIESSAHIPIPSYFAKDFFVKVVDNHAFLYMWDYPELNIFDITNPNAPVLEPTIYFTHYLTDVSVSNSYAYLTNWDYLQFVKVDMNLPQEPEVVSRLEVRGYGWGIDIKGDYAYLAMGAGDPGIPAGGLFIFDITDSVPVQRGHCPSIGDGWNHFVEVWVDTTEMRAYVSVGRFLDCELSESPGLGIIDVSDPNNPDSLGFCSIPDQCTDDVHKLGNYAYITTVDSGLYIIDIVNPAAPMIESRWYPGRSVTGVFVKDTFAYITYRDSLVVLNVSNPGMPVPVAAEYVYPIAADVVIDSIYAFVLSAHAVVVFDISDPLNPSLVTQSEEILGGATSIAVEGKNIFVSARSGLYTFEFHEVGVEETETTLPPELFQNSPNPFTVSTDIKYSVAKAGQVELKIYNLAGQSVKTLVNVKQKPGTYVVNWDCKDDNGKLLRSGMYFVKLKVGDFSQTKKLLLLK